MYTFEAEDDWTERTSRAVIDGLNAFNAAHGVTPSERKLAITVRDGADRVVGGLLGRTDHGWLYVGWLWVADEARARGLGRELMERAEAIACARGCHHAHLTTLDYQAREFYERCGYSVFGVLEDYPSPHQRIFMQKRLAGPR